MACQAHTNSDLLSEFVVVFDKMVRCDTEIKVLTLADAARVLMLDEKQFVAQQMAQQPTASNCHPENNAMRMIFFTMMMTSTTLRPPNGRLNATADGSTASQTTGWFGVGTPLHGWNRAEYVPHEEPRKCVKSCQVLGTP